LRAKVFLAQGQTDRTRDELETLCKERPDNVEAWAALANLEIGLQQWDRALQLLDQMQTNLGDTAILRSLRANYWAIRGGKSVDLDADLSAEAVDKLRSIEEQLDKFSTDDQLTVLGALVSAYERLNRPAELLRIFEQLAELRPNSKPTQFTLF